MAVGSRPNPTHGFGLKDKQFAPKLLHGGPKSLNSLYRLTQEFPIAMDWHISANHLFRQAKELISGSDKARDVILEQP